MATTTSTMKGQGAAARTGLAATTGTASVNALDDPNLLSTLVKSAKSAHSTLGRALDTTLSHQRFGGAEMEPSALTMNRLERERQLRLQQDLQRACGDTSLATRGSRTTTSDRIAAASGRASTVKAATAGVSSSSSTPASLAARSDSATTHGGLHIPPLPTMAPSMTAAADDGTESLGGTKIGGADRGYVTLIGAVPTFATTRQIEDNYELISSFRAYRTDAQRVERQTALRDVSAPHPDLLEQLAPLLQQRDASPQPALVDVETLPYSLRQAYAAQPQQRMLPGVTAPTSDDSGAQTVTEEDLDGEKKVVGSTTAVAESAPRGGTWSFTCQGRAAADRVKLLNYLPGQREPAVGQYYVRYGMVEPRVTGGYMAPQASAPAVAVTAAQPSNTDERAGEDAAEERRPDTGATVDGDRVGGDGGSVFAQTMRDDAASVADGRHGTEHSGDDGGAVQPHPTRPPGENVKGSSMFLSQVPRQASHGTAAPDVYYWPYPDVRSTVKHTPCFVQLDVPQTQRRREPLVTGVPASVYEVCDDIAANQPRIVTMNRSTGRETHWYGRVPPATNGEPLDVDEALRATQPKARAAILPPRTSEGDGDAHNSEKPPVDTSVSVERNLDFPRPLIGEEAQLTHVRDFGKVPSRAEREAWAQLGLTVAYQGDKDAHSLYQREEEEEEGYGAAEQTEPRSRSAIIHPSAPGHQDLHASSPTELGDVPSLALIKPRVGCLTDLGKGCARPEHMAPLHDLTYDTDRGYALTGGRVKGTPSIGRTVTRQQACRNQTAGCGAKVMYNPTDYLAPAVKSVPDFEKQITKEHEFRGHRVQSERYRRLFPAAPGPGHYTVNFSQVE